jgi:hypothetical protein
MQYAQIEFRTIRPEHDDEDMRALMRDAAPLMFDVDGEPVGSIEPVLDPDTREHIGYTVDWLEADYPEPHDMPAGFPTRAEAKRWIRAYVESVERERYEQAIGQQTLFPY